MQKYSLKIKILLTCVLVIAIFIGGCFAVYFGMRLNCRHELDELLAVDTDSSEN